MKQKCYADKCEIIPVFICSCQERLFTCQKHCFGHMGGNCKGSLSPYVDCEKKNSEAEDEKFYVLERNELINALFPNETCVVQCKYCGKLLSKTSFKVHVCERSSIKVFGVNFIRESCSMYMCSICQNLVHSSFIYPHADNHNVSSYPPYSSQDINLIAALILKNSSNNDAISIANSSQKTQDLLVPALIQSQIKADTATSLPQKRKLESVVFELDD